MKKIIARILLKLFKNKIHSLTLRNLKNNRYDLELFFTQFSAELSKETDKYPSLFNDGYKHIDKAIELSHFFNLPPDNLIIDVGSASGDTSIRFCKEFPASTIYSFEPIPDTFLLLKQETAAYANIHPINKALGNETKSITIHLAARITSSSLFNIKKNLSNKFWAENLEEKGTIEVPMSKLDIEIPQGSNVNILKIDVQGYELEVLSGGTELLNHTAIVLLEMQNHDLYVEAPKYYELDEYLRNNNFELYDIIPSIRQEKKLYEWDAIYVNKKNLK